MAYLISNPIIVANPLHRPKGLYRLYGMLDAHQRNFGKPIAQKVFMQKARIGESNLPIEVYQGTQESRIDESAFGMFYRRLITSGTNLSLGFVTSDKLIDFKIFNAYFDYKKLQRIELENLSGINVYSENNSTDIVIAPLRTSILKINVSSKGSAKIDGLMRLIFEGVPPIEIHVTGSRVLLWNIPPNWNSPMRETYAYRTDVITSYNKKEQRRSLITQPRRSMGFDVAIQNELLMSLRNTLYGWHNKTYLMPLWWQGFSLAENAAAGVSTVNVSSLQGIDSLQEFTQLVIWRNPFDTELVTIRSISGNTITLLTPLENDYGKNTQIYPVVDVMINGNLTIQNLTSQVSTAEIAATIINKSAKVKLLEDDRLNASFYNGVEVLTVRPNWKNATEDSFQSDIEAVDYNYGSVEYFGGTTPTLMTKTATFMSKNRHTTAWWRRFIHRQRGQLKSFFVPTNTKDLVLAKDGNNGAKEFLMKDLYLSSIVNNSKERKILGIRIYGKDYFFTIENIENIEILDGLARVVVKEEIPIFMPKQDVTFINFLQRMRFASDEIEIEHITSEVAQLTLKFKQVKELK